MRAEELIREISDYCRVAGVAESTFGRASINDGKLVTRLRNGGRITTETLDKIRSFIARNPASDGASRHAVMGAPAVNDSVATSSHAASANGAQTTPDAATPPPVAALVRAADGEDPQRNFRFFDNRQKYLLFVNTCSEKWEVANRVSQEIAYIHPRPPAVRIFDAGVGDGTILSRVLRAMHARYTNMPFYVVGKEISLEDVRLTLEKMPDRFTEHPSTVLVLTNLAYADAPRLHVRSATAAASMVWHEVALQGNSSHSFEEQITALEPFLAESWKAGVSAKTGNPVYERPVVLIVYREDHKFLLDPIIPKQGTARADFDLVIASQPYRARASVDFKAKRVIAPLARALGPGGRLIGIHSCGNDPGMEIIRKVWPEDDPFKTDRHNLMKAVKTELGAAGRDLNFNTYSDQRSLFKYHMHTLPQELEGSIGTSTAFAAWNAAIYVAQVEDDRLGPVVSNARYLDATREVLHKHGGLWFYDESYVISRRRS